MLLQISTTHSPATDLGFLLHKHPDKLQTIDLSVGSAHVFYSEADNETCTACLLLDINPVELVRNKNGGNIYLQEHYVNDRAYTANSFLSTAISKCFGSALNGTCHQKPELTTIAIPLTVKLSSLKVDTDFSYLDKLFAPLGYQVSYERLELDKTFTDWGKSQYVNLTLQHVIPLKDLLSHLYVFIIVLDNDRHYWVTKNDIDVLLKRGANWLDTHPEKEWISRRYLKNLHSFASEALIRLAGEELKPEEPQTVQSERKLSLHQKRLQKAYEFLKASKAESVIDMGCGEGKLLKLLIKDNQFKKIRGTDVSFGELQKARENLYLHDASPTMRERIEVFQSSVTYKDERLKGFDAAALVEVIEHLDTERLSAMERAVFGFAQPQTIVLSTPNAEYNVLFSRMEPESFRHEDHRFEWTRVQFSDWCERICEQYQYAVSSHSVGDEDMNVGAPSQMAVFKKK